jgi:excisionase family DNA binding protein
MKDPRSESLVTVTEAKSMLRIGTTSLYAMLKRGDLDGVLLGPRMRRIKKSSVDRLIQHGVKA